MLGFLTRRQLSALSLTAYLVKSGRALARSSASYAPAYAMAIVTRGSKSGCVRLDFNHEAATLHMTIQNANFLSSCYKHKVKIHGTRMSIDDALSDMLVKRPLEVEGALRLLQSRRNQAFLFDDHDDSLLVVRFSARIAPQVRARFWLEGARLEAAGMSSEQRIIFGWDNRNQNILAFDMLAGRVVGTTVCEADYVTF
ncbi:hypothetical protein GFGA_2c0017 (plasmid) [Gluconobacter frateurii NBRC 103465]|nr:hypothetical protein GFGA_2c0017 [Gluconobacter frateurii NBRC 103465]